VYAYINAENNTIIIDTASRGKAEDVLSLLRKAIGTLPVKGVETKVEPSEVMTSWVSGLFDFNSAAQGLRLALRLTLMGLAMIARPL